MQVAKWGNSLAVRLPKKLVDEMGLKPGDEIAIVEAEPGKIAIEKIDRREHENCAVADRSHHVFLAKPLPLLYADRPSHTRTCRVA